MAYLFNAESICAGLALKSTVLTVYSTVFLGAAGCSWYVLHFLKMRLQKFKDEYSDVQGCESLSTLNISKWNS